MEEVAHFRAFVAARNSVLLAASEEHLQHAVDAVDAVVANLGILLKHHLIGMQSLQETSFNIPPAAAAFKKSLPGCLKQTSLACTLAHICRLSVHEG